MGRLKVIFLLNRTIYIDPILNNQVDSNEVISQIVVIVQEKYLIDD